MTTPAQMSAPARKVARHRAQRAGTGLHWRGLGALLTFTLLVVVTALVDQRSGDQATAATFVETSAEPGAAWLGDEDSRQNTRSYPAPPIDDRTAGAGAEPRTTAHRGTAAASRSGDRTEVAEQGRPRTGGTHHTRDGAGATRRAPGHARQARHDATQTAKSARAAQRNQPGYCLAWARTRAGIGERYVSAAEAWRHAAHKHRGDRRPPVGAAVYWTGGSHGYGHIAIAVGHGKVRSTDSGGEGRIATVGVNWPVRHWGLRYAGWANNINGYTIPGVGDHR